MFQTFWLPTAITDNDPLLFNSVKMRNQEEEEDSEASQSQSQRSVPLVDQFTGISIKVLK